MVVHEVFVLEHGNPLQLRHDLGTTDTDVWGRGRDGKLYRPNVLRHVDPNVIRVVFDPEPMVIEVWDQPHARMFRWTRDGPSTLYRYPT